MNHLYAVASDFLDHSNCGKNCSLKWPSEEYFKQHGYTYTWQKISQTTLTPIVATTFSPVLSPVTSPIEKLTEININETNTK